jgi:hypothetical protein
MRLGFPYVTAGNGVGKTQDLLPLHDKKKIDVLCVMGAHYQICTIAGQEHQRVNNMFHQHSDCMSSGRQHFQHLL